MKRKIITSLVVLAVSAVSGYGVSKKLNSENDVLQNLTLSNVETLSSSEWGFWDGVGNTLKGQGWTKDEREWKRNCPNKESGGKVSGGYGGVSGSVEGYDSQYNPYIRKEITCPVGEVNCSEIEC